MAASAWSAAPVIPRPVAVTGAPAWRTLAAVDVPLLLRERGWLDSAEMGARRRCPDTSTFVWSSSV